jgi:hypothetical protein
MVVPTVPVRAFAGLRTTVPGDELAAATQAHSNALASTKRSTNMTSWAHPESELTHDGGTRRAQSWRWSSAATGGAAHDAMRNHALAHRDDHFFDATRLPPQQRPLVSPHSATSRAWSHCAG